MLNETANGGQPAVFGSRPSCRVSTRYGSGSEHGFGLNVVELEVRHRLSLLAGQVLEEQLERVA